MEFVIGIIIIVLLVLASVPISGIGLIQEGQKLNDSFTVFLGGALFVAGIVLIIVVFCKILG